MSTGDGLSPVPSDNNETAASRPRVRQKKQAGAPSTEVSPNLQTKDRWEQQQALDQAEEEQDSREN